MDSNERFTVWVVGLRGPATTFHEQLVAAGVRPEQVSTILSTMPCQVKANVARDVADRFADAFRQAGAEVTIKPVAPPAPAQAPASATAAGSPAPSPLTPAVAVARASGPAAETPAGESSSADRARRAEAEIGARRASLLQREAHSLAPLSQRPGRALPYAMSKSVLLVLAGLAVIAYFLSWVPLIGGIFAGGLEAAIYFRMVENTAHGDESLTAPDFTSVYDSLIAPFIRYVATLLPIIIAVIWAGYTLIHFMVNPLAGSDREFLSALQGPGLLFLAGVVLWPLLTVVAALNRSAIAVLNPLSWIAGLRVLGFDYVIAVLVFYAVLLFEAFVVLPVVLRVHFIPIVSPIFVAFVMHVFMAMRARILGALLQPHV